MNRILAVSAFAGLMLAPLSAPLFAQQSAPIKTTRTIHVVSSAAARALADACSEWATQNRQPVAMAILDWGGNVVESHAMEGAAPNAIATALLKARNALRWRRPSSETAEIVRKGQNLAPTYIQGDFPQPGALPIIINGELLGRPDAGADMTFEFPRLIAHAAKTRPLSAGCIVGFPSTPMAISSTEIREALAEPVNAIVEAVRRAQERFGKGKIMTGEQIRWGLENLALDQKALDKLGLGTIMRPLSTSCLDHEGSRSARLHTWDGKKWNVAPKVYQADMQILKPMQDAFAKKYAEEKKITPRDCSKEASS